MSLRSRWRAFRSRLVPGPRAWAGARRGVVLAALAIFVAGVWPVFALPTFNWTALIPILLLPLVAFLAGGLVILARGLLSALPRAFLWAVASVLTVYFFLLASAEPKGLLVSSLYAILAGALAGAGLVSLRAPRAEGPRGLARAAAAGGLALGVVLLALGVGWLVWDGPAEKPISDAALSATAPVPLLDLPDPGEAGPYAVRELTYGSGTDRHRPEFGEKAALRSRSVDGSLLVERWKGAVGWAREAYWGFDAKHLPLQGRVWYPEGAGPFPIVLMVHGNHLAEDFSDPGYEYLGRLFASRGTIAVSVDENFLNSTLSDVLGLPDGWSAENDARGWLLLEHLRQWREWNRTPGNPFAGRVDLERVGLVGHSRGGEAVAVAGVFNRLPFYPDDARLAFDYGFGIRGIAAIAPVDGQYKPAGDPTRLANVSYLVVHGSHDGDMQSFHGSRVFERVRFTDGADRFKAGVYVHRANHGQFNTTWGRGDKGGLGDRFLNLRPILPKEDQEKVARVFLSAFVEATLHGEAGYRALFRDHRRGASWLPAGVYLQQYADSATRVLADYDDDIDVTTAAVPGARLLGENLSDWKEREAEIKWGGLDTRAVWLGWNREKAKATPSYALLLPEPGVAAGPDDVLAFHLADAKQEPSPPLDEEKPGRDEKKKDESKKENARKDEAPKPIDLTVEIEDAAGRTARLPLGRFHPLQPRIDAPVTKAAWLADQKPSELVFDSFEFPLAAFRAATPGLDPSRLRAVRFLFDRTEKGVVVLDDLALR
jgi:dienelactone hydrolase